MLPFKGRNELKIYAPHKPDKYGFRMYSLCDSKNKYLCNFFFHGDKIEKGILTPENESETSKIVMFLLDPYLESQYD